jgi:hypothetical protein
MEEYMVLQEHDGTFDILTKADCVNYPHIAVIPTMNVQTVKKDEDGLPV